MSPLTPLTVINVSFEGLRLKVCQRKRGECEREEGERGGREGGGRERGREIEIWRVRDI